MTRAGLLVTGHVPAGSRHLGGDYPELFSELLGPVGVEVVSYDCTSGQLPGSVDECDGWLCSPARHSVLDDLPWLPAVEELLRELIATERPFVGICFGHQLLAQALGGRVERAEVGWRIGIEEYEIVSRQAWMHPPADRVALLASHEDQVTVLPPDTRLMARSEHCQNAAMLVGERAWTIQTHPEFTASLADHLYASRVDLIGAAPVAAARATLSRGTDRRLVAEWIARFLEMSS